MKNQLPIDRHPVLKGQPLIRKSNFFLIKKYHLILPFIATAGLLVISIMALMLNRPASAILTPGDPNLVSFWTFNNAGDLGDDSLATNDLTINGSVSSGTPKIGSGSLELDAATEYLSSTNSAAFSSEPALPAFDGSYTLSVWVNLADISTPQMIATKINEYQLLYSASQNKFFYNAYATAACNNGTICQIGGGSAITANTWYHLVIVHDVIGNKNYLYVNNGSNVINSQPNSFTTSNFYVGNSNTGTLQFLGNIDALGFWKRALSAAEVRRLWLYDDALEYPFAASNPTVTTNTALSVSDTSAWLSGQVTDLAGDVITSRSFKYEADPLSLPYDNVTTAETGFFGKDVFGTSINGLSCGTTYHFIATATNDSGFSGDSADATFTTAACNATTLDDTLVSFWKLDENGGIRMDEFNTNHLSEIGGTILNYWDGKVRTAADINSAKYLTIDNNSSLRTGGIDFSVSAWVYLNSTDNNQVFASKYREWILFLAGKRFYFSTYSSNGAVAHSAISTTIPNLGQYAGWYHIVGVHNFSTNRNYIYVNAVPENNVASIEPSGTFIGKFQVGAMGDGFRFINSRVDALGFWRKALTGAEVTELYKSGYGMEYPFTLIISAPSVTTDAATAVADDSATANGNITSIGNENASSRGFEYGLTLGYGTTVTQTGSFNTGVFSASLTNLRCSSLYNVRAFAVNSAGTGSGGNQTFTTGACTNSITIDSPSSYQVIQRNGSNQANINISGHYTNNNSTVPVLEARWNGGAWADLVATPEVGWTNGGTFTGVLTNQPAGQGTLQVRFKNDIAVVVSVTYVGIGDIFAIAGQSNAMGRGFNPQIYTAPVGNPTLKAAIFGNDNLWDELADPVDSPTNQVDVISNDAAALGSIWPLLATLIMADQNVPVAFVPAASASSFIDKATAGIYPYWEPDAPNDRNTLFGSMHYRIDAVGGVKSVLYWQGESEAKFNISQAAYLSELNNLANGLDTFIDTNLTMSVAQIGDFANADCCIGVETRLDNIRLAQKQTWDTNPNVVIGPSLYDVNLLDEVGEEGLHFTTDGDLQTAANRWWVALKQAYYGGTEGRGPRVKLVEHTPGTTTVKVIFETSSPLLPTTGIQGFTVKEGITTKTILSADVIDDAYDNKVLLTLSAPTAVAVTVSYAQGRTANRAVITNVLTDSSTYNLPAEVFVSTASSAPDVIVPLITVNEDVDAGPVSSDIINLTVTDINLNTSTLKYGFSPDIVCDGSDTYLNSFTNAIDFTITGNHVDYLCAKAEDWSGNIGYLLVGVLNIRSSGSGSQYITPPCQMFINSGQTTTDSLIVALKFAAFDQPGQMLISNVEDFTNANWEPFISDKVWTLAGESSSYGLKTVYARVRNIYGTISNICSDSIEYLEKGSPIITEEPQPALLPAGVDVGDLIKLEAITTVYFIDDDNRRHSFPNEPVFFSYFPSFDGIKIVSDEIMAKIPLGSNITVRPGTNLVKIESDPRVYAVEPYGVLRWLSDQQIIEKLYGLDWENRLIDIAPTFFIDYQEGQPIAEAVYPTGSVIEFNDQSNLYYIEQDKKRYISTEAYWGNKFQNQFILRNVSALIAYENGLDLPVMTIEQIIDIR